MSTRIFAIVALVVVALAGCKKRSSKDMAEQALARMEQFANEMCTCTDKGCADRVQERMTKWATDMASDPANDRSKPSETVMKVMVDAGQRYADCMTVAMTHGSDVETAEGSGSATATRPPPDIKLSTPKDRPSIGKLVQEAKEYTRAAEDDLVIHVLHARYVADDGELDPTYGELVIGFGNRLPGAPRIEDDPDRPTGAPLPEPRVAPPPKRPNSAFCPNATWTAKAGWDWGERSCFAQLALAPKCSMAEVWKRARAAKGTEIKGKAVAIIALEHSEDKRPIWEFSIRDELREVYISTAIADTCVPVAEKP